MKRFFFIIIIIVLLVIISYLLAERNNLGGAFRTLTPTPTKTAAATFTPIPTSMSTPIPTPVFILVPCMSEQQSPLLEVEEHTEEWFLSEDAPMLSRNEYMVITEWEYFCDWVKRETTPIGRWAENPIELAMKIAGYPNIDNLAPFSVKTFYANKDSNVVSVTILNTNQMDDATRDRETRIDLVNNDGIWHVQWVGIRHRCYRNNNPDWVAALCP